jgi:ribosome biogenesis GTPase / thiamine phosphate phosphatase
MNLKDLGWKKYREKLEDAEKLDQENIGRVAVENRGGYLLYTEMGELEGIMRGKFMNLAKLESQYPKVGDWVIFEKLAGEQKAIITSILPRQSKLSRRRVAKDREAILDKKEEQIIATNLDLVFVVQGLDGDFNLSRLERYVAMAKEGDCQPVILLNKCDVASDNQAQFAQVKKALPEVELLLISAKAEIGLEKVRALIGKGISVVFVGSSGAGKSTLINKLLGSNSQGTNEVRADDSKGKHTTTKREMILLPEGGILIDTPGMRELGLWAGTEAVAETFEDIEVLIEKCRFSDCDHRVSLGCAVIAAVERDELPRARYENFLKISGELDAKIFQEKRKIQDAQKRASRKNPKRVGFKK